jgi:hypothetical protein
LKEIYRIFDHDLSVELVCRHEIVLDLSIGQELDSAVSEGRIHCDKISRQKIKKNRYCTKLTVPYIVESYRYIDPSFLAPYY